MPWMITDSSKTRKQAFAAVKLEMEKCILLGVETYCIQ